MKSNFDLYILYLYISITNLYINIYTYFLYLIYFMYFYIFILNKIKIIS